MAKPRLLDLFCKAGGASMGYHRAGFEVVGVDIEPQKNYPFEFIQDDAMTFPLDGFDVIHASPPCQRFSATQRLNRREWPDLVAGTRERLEKTGKPWIIENVPGAPLVEPIMLCGAMFDGLTVYRHRLFETSFGWAAPAHPGHIHPQTKMGRQPKEGEWMHIVGHWVNKPAGQKAMGIDWMTSEEMAEAIPPAYTEFIGRQILNG